MVEKPDRGGELAPHTWSPAQMTCSVNGFHDTTGFACQGPSLWEMTGCDSSCQAWEETERPHPRVGVSVLSSEMFSFQFDVLLGSWPWVHSPCAWFPRSCGLSLSLLLLDPSLWNCNSPLPSSVVWGPVIGMLAPDPMLRLPLNFWNMFLCFLQVPTYLSFWQNDFDKKLCLINNPKTPEWQNTLAYCVLTTLSLFPVTCSKFYVRSNYLKGN
jgi:hypothetical protein